jgi:hypothetical protein
VGVATLGGAGGPPAGGAGVARSAPEDLATRRATDPGAASTTASIAPVDDATAVRTLRGRGGGSVSAGQAPHLQLALVLRAVRGRRHLLGVGDDYLAAGTGREVRCRA